MKKITLIYLSSYLFIGGIGFGFIPEMALKLFMATGIYGGIMPRMVGMFMIVLGFFITLFIKNEDYKYYLPTIIARTFIVLIGLLPSIYIYLKGESDL